MVQALVNNNLRAIGIIFRPLHFFLKNILSRESMLHILLGQFFAIFTPHDSECADLTVDYVSIWW